MAIRKNPLLIAGLFSTLCRIYSSTTSGIIFTHHLSGLGVFEKYNYDRVKTKNAWNDNCEILYTVVPTDNPLKNASNP
ncbi:MAG: hypothetical protein GY875_23655 [Gammaproteobacteria bacterium]|nr:hypothetical protein [Gammaproteobacteria bacterium]